MKQQGKKNLPTLPARSAESILVITESILVITGASRVAAILLFVGVCLFVVCFVWVLGVF